MVDAFADEKEAYTQFLPLDLSYEGWKTFVKSYFQNLEPRARVISLPGGAVLLQRDGQGVVSKTVLRGSDVTVSRVGSAVCQLTHITVSDPQSRDSGLRIYFVTARPTLKIAKSLARDWGETLKCGRLFVALSDSDLPDLGDSHVPIIPPFATSITAVLAEHGSGTLFSCDSAAAGRMECR